METSSGAVCRRLLLVVRGGLALGALSLPACSDPGSEREELKAELKREVLAELAADRALDRSAQGVARGGAAAEAGGAPSGRRAPRLPRAALGAVSGRVLLGGRGLPECRVQLVRMEGSGGGLGLFSIYRLGEVLETTTDAGGVYRFDDVPVGPYRLRWLPRGESGWIRRLSERPDVVVVEGGVTDAGVFRAGRPVAGG